MWSSPSNFSSLFVLLFIITIGFTSCSHTIKWQVHIDRAGTYSSPRAVDLNSDGIKDIVIGAGGMREWESSINGVLAFDGRTGNLLWKKDCRNHLVGSPVFMDITGDGIQDVVIGGRSAQLMALNGEDGSLIWEFMPDTGNINFEKDTTILNFFNPQFISDQNKDGLKDIIIAYGGYVEAKPFETNRPCGYLMIFSVKDGELLARAPMPDGKETYMSPVVIKKGNEELVFFGSGGETIPGSFYVTNVEDIIDGAIDDHRQLLQGEHKGFIAPPVMVNLDNDEVLDIVINAYEGRTFALSGATYNIIWSVDVGMDYETHSQPVPGNFIGNSATDFVINYCQGTWPNVTGSIQIVIDGDSGEHQVISRLGNLQYSSPIALRKGSNEKDWVCYPVNEKYETNYAPETGFPAQAFNNIVYLIDIEEGKNTVLFESKGTNIGSTLLAEDLNGDGSLERIYAFNTNPYNPFESKGLTVVCETMPGYTSPWNQYMGPEGKSHFHTL